MVSEFPDEFGQPGNSLIEYVKDIGLKTCELSEQTHFIKINKLGNEIKKIKSKIYDEIKPTEDISVIVRKHRDNYEKIMYKIHRHTGIAIKELKSMNVYDFYTYKKNIKEEKPNG